MKFIGITGGVGSGKSAILDYLREDPRYLVSEADRIAEDLLNKDEPLYKDMVSLLGSGILSPDGPIDRKKMAECIFNDVTLRDKVNSLIHPAVRDFVLSTKAKAEESQKYDIYFLEAALLIECGYDKICDELWYIYAEPAIRKKRLKEGRGYPDEKTENIIKSQLPDSIFREKCDRIIDNSGKLESTLRSVDIAIHKCLSDDRKN